jgi:hypothetical protein
MNRPPLIDEVVARHENGGKNHACINGGWYIAKPLSYPSFFSFQRAWHAWLVFRSRAMAVEFMEDRHKNGTTL